MSRLLRLLAAAWLAPGLVAVTACDTNPVEVESIEAAVAGGTDDIEAIRAAQSAAWSAKDAEAYAATYASDARFINPLGQVLVGRGAIQAVHAALFAGPFAPSTETLAIADVRFLTGTIAVVQINSSLTGYAGLPPGLIPTEPGVVRTVKTWVVAKRAGSWQIVTQQITAVAPAP